MIMNGVTYLNVSVMDIYVGSVTLFMSTISKHCFRLILFFSYTFKAAHSAFNTCMPFMLILSLTLCSYDQIGNAGS